MNGAGGIALRAGLLALAGWYALRAVIGVPAGIDFSQGSAHAADGAYAAALDELERGAVGGNRYEARWLAGQVRLGLWDATGPAAGDPALLAGALSDGAEAARLSPASGWPWALMAATAWRAEQAARASREFRLEWLSASPWARVGPDGRRAVGWTREAVAREPRTQAYRDQAVQVLLDLGLDEAGLAAAREAAAVQPVFGLHDFGPAGEREDVRAAFEEGSRKALGATPLLSRERHLLALALLNEGLGRADRAIADLQAALRERAPRIQNAEDAYHLGRILLRQGRAAEAEPWLARAAAVEVFAPAVGTLRAEEAERQGDLEGALLRLQEVRRVRPRELWPLLEFARIARKAGRTAQALEALDWAALNHPGDPRPRVLRVETLVEAGRLGDARRALPDLRRSGVPAAEVERLERLCAAPDSSP